MRPINAGDKRRRVASGAGEGGSSVPPVRLEVRAREERLDPAAAEFDARSAKPKKAFVFNQIRFDRRFGHVDCNTVAIGQGNAYAPVCQFSGPALLAVTTDKGRFFFAPGAGKPVTIITENGSPRCVMDGNFRPEVS